LEKKEEQVLPGSEGLGGKKWKIGGEMAQTMYTHVTK
jgi:hypothetical protein